MLAMTAVRVGRVFQNLESHRSMAGDEIVIVERVDECPFHAGKGAILQCFPRDFVRDRDQFRSERAHPIDLRFRRGLDCDDAAGHASLSRGVGDALAGVARADCPDAAGALGLGQHRYGVDRAAQFVGIDRLEILEL